MFCDCFVIFNPCNFINLFDQVSILLSLRNLSDSFKNFHNLLDHKDLNLVGCSQNWPYHFIKFLQTWSISCQLIGSFRIVGKKIKNLILGPGDKLPHIEHKRIDPGLLVYFLGLDFFLAFRQMTKGVLRRFRRFERFEALCFNNGAEYEIKVDGILVIIKLADHSAIKDIVCRFEIGFVLLSSLLEVV